MKIGGFQLREPVPECNEPYALTTIRPWIDVNNVGTLVLGELEARYGTTELGKLSKPGDYFDFTRYRPIIHIDNGIHEMSIPNSRIYYAKREGKNDLFMIHLMEPHTRAENYVNSVVRFLKTFKVKKYILLGSMYDSVPHTRPLLISGYGAGKKALQDIKKAGALPITYRGPSSMVNLITMKAAKAGIETVVFIVSLPQYVVLEEDYLGKVRIMEVLNALYDIPIDKSDFDRAMEQRSLVGERVGNSPEVRALVPHLEAAYDLRVKAVGAEDSSGLTPEMEDLFWKIMGKDIGRA